MIRNRKLLIQIPEGLEARPVALLVQVASQYEQRDLCGEQIIKR